MAKKEISISGPRMVPPVMRGPEFDPKPPAVPPLDVISPVFQSAAIPANGMSLTMTYNEALDTASVPAPARFSLSGTGVAISSVQVIGSTVVLNFGSAVLQGATVGLTYTPAAAPIQDVAGNDAGMLVGAAVTNSSTVVGGDTTAPVIQTAIVPANGLTLALTYNETLGASTPAAGAFVLAGTASTVSSVGVAGAVVTLTLNTAAFAGETITVSYTPGGAPIEDVAGNDAIALTNRAVTNNSAVTLPESRAAAEVGPFANANVSLSVASANDFGSGVTIITCFDIVSRSTNQTVWGTAGTTGGCQEQFGPTSHGLFFTNGTTMTYAEGAPPLGLNCSANTRLASGPVRGCRNGAAAVQRNAAPTYVAVTGTASTTLGRHAGATAANCSNTKILWQAKLMRDATDAELQSWTDQVNQLDRYRPPASLVTAINATGGGSWLWDAATDYDSAAATSVTGIGTGPTWTRNSNLGSGFPAKTVLEAEIEHVINLSDWHFNVQDVSIAAASGGPTYRRGNCFREYRFSSNAVRFSVKGICDWSGIPNMANLGVRQDNVALTPLNFDRFSVFRRLDVQGLSGTHAYRIIDGAQAIAGGASSGTFDSSSIKGICSVSVQAPKTATFTVTAPAPAANRLVVMGDSFAVGQNCTLSPTQEAAAMLMRDEYPGDVICYTFGSGGHWHMAKDTSTVNAFVASLQQAFSGATSKRIQDDMGQNDHNLFTTFWTDRANMRTRIGALYDAINAADGGIRIHMRTSLLRTAAYEGSTVSDISGPGTGAGTAVGGVINQDVRTDFATVQSTRTGFTFLLSGIPIFPNFAPSSNHNADNFHPSPAGHVTIKAAEKIHLAATADSVGSGY